MKIQELCDIIERRKDELFILLSDLVKINSESIGSVGNEEECAGYIYKLCKEMNLETDLFSPLDVNDFEHHPDYIPGRNLENRYNVVARYQGVVNEDELMLMAHTDTVKTGDVSSWDLDPFSGEIRDGKIFGRGATDDKYGIATALFVMKVLKDYGFVPKKNLLFAAYSDEEYGGSHGALSTVLKYPAKRIVNMDTSGGKITHCASGGQEIKFKFHTKDVTDSAEKAAKAISTVIETINSEFGKKRKNELMSNRFYKGTAIPETSLRYMGVKAGNSGADLGCGEVHFVFYTDKTKDEIWSELDALKTVLEEKLDKIGIKADGFEGATRFFHYAFCEPDSEDIALMVEASNETSGIEPPVCGSCLSDMSVISKYGSNRTFSFGVGRGFAEIGGAHQPNEFIECDRLLYFAKTIGAYVLKVLNS